MKSIKITMASLLKKKIDNYKNTGQFYIELCKLFNMSTVFENFWDVFIDMRNKNFPTPTYISVYKARYEHGFTQQVLFSLNKEGLIRTNGATPPKYALEDIELMKKIRNQINRLESEGVVKFKNKVAGSVVMEVTVKNLTGAIENNVSKALEIALSNIYGELYTFIPKNLSKKEAIKYLEDTFDKK